jgi:hypothetical protein
MQQVEPPTTNSGQVTGLSSCPQIKQEDVDIFLKGSGALDIASVKKKPKVGTIREPENQNSSVAAREGPS